MTKNVEKLNELDLVLNDAKERLEVFMIFLTKLIIMLRHN